MDSFRHLHQATGRIIQHQQSDYLFFGGTAYLGLLINPDYQELVLEGIKKYGLNNGTSRSNNVQLGVYDEAEERMAKRFGFEASALFSSGYLAAQATVQTLSRKGEVIYAPHSHQALWLFGAPKVESTIFDQWLLATISYINESNNDSFVIIANAIDNLTPAQYDFSPLVNIKSTKNITLILDDSHGLAVVNKNAVSADISIFESCQHIEVVLLASLAKGLGTDAGIVLGSKETIAEVKKSPIFMGASPSSPGFVYALVNSEAIYTNAFERLQCNIQFFAEEVKNLSSLKSLERFPVFTSTNPNLYRHLCHKGFLISSFPYPLPHSPLLNRIVISALHEKGDLVKLSEVLQEYG